MELYTMYDLEAVNPYISSYALTVINARRMHTRVIVVCLCVCVCVCVCVCSQSASCVGHFYSKLNIAISFSEGF